MTGPKPKSSSHQNLSPETLTAQALGNVDATTRALVPPIHPSATFERDADGEYRSGRGYSRPHNPSYDEPESLLATLEGGSDCMLFASGMAAATAVFQSLLPGDHVLAPRVMYWALRKWLIESAMSWGLDVEFLDTGDLDQLRAAMRPGKTRLVWLETPANPTWDVTDIAAASVLAHEAGARVVVDSTVASPVITRPIEHGADLVMHSATKYLNGHGDLVAGALVCREQGAFWHRIQAWRRDGGAILGAFEAWLLLRGMRTLFVRVQRCSESAMAIARHFHEHPKLHAVLYPGLPDHPGYDIAERQMKGGFGGMLSIRHRGGQAGAMETAARVKVFKRATSLGGVESLIEHRASIEGPSTPVPVDLLRFSIGLENLDDLIADLEQALDHAVADEPRDDLKTSLPPLSPTGNPLAHTIEKLLAERVRPVATERGGDLRVKTVADGVVQLEISGSPGSVFPLRAQINALIRHHVDPDLEIAFLSSDGAGAAAEGGSVAARMAALLDNQINPAVSAHGGEIRLTRIEKDVAYVSFEGGCQGCAMADVTLRQGVEVLIKEHVPEIVSVVDETDHAQGRQPYFKTRKGA
jgi:cystathionine gamma-synthase